MKLKKLLNLYKELKARHEEKLKKLTEEYSRRLDLLIHDILTSLDELSKKEPPGNVDPHLLKIALRERKAYVSTLRRILESVSSMDDLGRKLGELSKLHVGHGRYLLAIFEKDVYKINRLLKELGELYTEYSAEIAKLKLPEVDPNRTIEEIEKTKTEIRELEEELEKIRESISELEMIPVNKDELERISRERESLEVRARTLETEVRSKASKLQKPLKRMRLPEAAPFLRDSSYAVEHPEEFLELVKKIYPNLNGKSRKAADWILNNFPAKIEELRRVKAELSGIKEREAELMASSSGRLRELEGLRRRAHEIEDELKKLRNRLESLEEELQLESEVLRALLKREQQA
ncbi:hypothetical protein X802_00140 [Thermococcus guaymasensis DSM 11113]|uniref:Uncharacterized protein n=1 Tax=Thermococcus guaymasensis DSM 11113 TaxID=1432656 RepID=A0A0X1KHP0_9EURY|nr:DNA repair protein Rad50 [Thermococcus guaymasensis]AJC70776.1 hypothetical protein X802_00140 [Thermococcus guaymasensis DSM 11113]